MLTSRPLTVARRAIVGASVELMTVEPRLTSTLQSPVPVKRVPSSRVTEEWVTSVIVASAGEQTEHSSASHVFQQNYQDNFKISAKIYIFVQRILLIVLQSLSGYVY